MDGNNLEEQSTLAEVHSSVTFGVFLSVVGIISVALAVTLYQFLLVRYCRHRHYSSDHQVPAVSTGHHYHPRSSEEEESSVVPISWFGLDDRALEHIPVLPYCERARDFFRIDQSECVVCLGILEHGERVRWLPGCTHAFHVACIDDWLRARASCPTCRAPVVVPPPLLSQFVVGAAFVNGSSGGGGLTRARSGGALRRGSSDAKAPEADSSSLSVGLVRSLSMDHSCIVIEAEEQRDRSDGDCSSLSLNSSSCQLESRSTSLMRSIFGFMVQGGDRGILPY